jgi:HEAT repeat protein
MTGQSNLLSRFQQLGDLEALAAHGRALGYDEARLRGAIDVLRPVFARLSFGEQPDYGSVDRRRLREHEWESALIVRCMADSDRADLRSAGLQLMGVMDSSVFLDDLGQAMASNRDWERIESARALGRMSLPSASSILESAIDHPDPPTRRAVREALQHFNTRGSENWPAS